jgi:hypothetical protein
MKFSRSVKNPNSKNENPQHMDSHQQVELNKDVSPKFAFAQNFLSLPRYVYLLMCKMELLENKQKMCKKIVQK